MMGMCPGWQCMWQNAKGGAACRRHCALLIPEVRVFDVLSAKNLHIVCRYDDFYDASIISNFKHLRRIYTIGTFCFYTLSHGPWGGCFGGGPRFLASYRERLEVAPKRPVFDRLRSEPFRPFLVIESHLYGVSVHSYHLGWRLYTRMRIYVLGDECKSISFLRRNFWLFTWTYTFLLYYTHFLDLHQLNIWFIDCMLFWIASHTQRFNLL